jgi:hypothetical protein
VHCSASWPARCCCRAQPSAHRPSRDRASRADRPPRAPPAAKRDGAPGAEHGLGAPAQGGPLATSYRGEFVTKYLLELVFLGMFYFIARLFAGTAPGALAEYGGDYLSF